MKILLKSTMIATLACAAGMLLLQTTNVSAASAEGLAADSRAALRDLYRSNPKAHDLGKKALAILVFPKIVKAGFVVAAHRGDGTLFDRDGKVTGYYNTSAGSFGIQAGIQKFGYALFFMNSKALKHLHNQGGWELGTEPNVVILDKGGAASLNTSQIKGSIYGYFFDPKGLMAGIDLQGSKITEIHPQ